MNLENKQVNPTAIVTGAARRIGAEIARALHQAGFRIVIHCHQSLSEANQLATALNVERADSALAVQFDLSVPEACDSLIEAAIQWTGSLHVLVNNASLFMRSDLSQPQCNLGESLYALNVFAPWRLSVNARPWLEKVSGNIINITDIHAEKPLKGYAEYCQSKAALWMQTKALAREFAPHLRVNAVAPGAIVWPEQENIVSQSVKNQIMKETPLNMHGHPQFIADAVLALIANPFITGQVLRVDGGRSIG